MNETTLTAPGLLLALDIDGTLLDRDQVIPAETVAAVDLVRAAGHRVVLATGRSLVGVLPVVRHLSLVDGWAVASNGALTVRLDQATPAGYLVTEARTFDPGPVITRARTLSPTVRVAVEEVGWGWRVSRIFDAGLLNGDEKLSTTTDLCAEPAPRVVLHAPGVRRWVDALAATGVTVTPAGPDWLDITPLGADKATALEAVRERLGVPRERTVAVGDGVNDIPMLAWAERGVAMGHAPAIVRNTADETTTAITDQGVIPVLHSLVPPQALTPDLSRLAAQLTAASRTLTGPGVARVWHGLEHDLAGCEIWTLHGGRWARHAPIPAATGLTMRDVENAAREAGLDYPSGDTGRRRARWHTSPADLDRPAGFDLPIHLT